MTSGIKQLFRLLTLWLSLVIAGASSAFAAGTAGSGQLNEIIDRVDALYSKRANLVNVRDTLGLLNNSTVESEYEVMWRKARSLYWLGHKAKGKDRLPLFEQGRDIADDAMKANPKGPDGYYWHAVNIGKIGLEKGILNSLASVKPMKADLEKVLALDDDYADAYRVLSELYAKVPGWPLSVGDAKKAVAYAEDALEKRPNSIAFNRVAAEAYLKAKNEKLAIARLEAILKLPLSSEEPDDDREHKDWAKDELKKLR